MMDHNIANETYAAERYLLGEMAPEERDEFEDHFFSCRVCGENVQAASVFVENTKAVFQQEASGTLPKRLKRDLLRRDWLAWLRLPVTVPSFAAVLLAAVVTYQNAVVIPELRAPQSMGAPIVLDGETRAALLPRITEGAPLRFQMLLVHATASDRILVDIAGAAGNIVLSGSVPAPGSRAPLDVYFPGTLKPGRYTLIARSGRGGDAGQELARNQFDVASKGE